MTNRAVILAAGMGSRLAPITDSVPKCLVKLDNHTILHEQVKTLRECGIDDITVVGGYKVELIKEYDKKHGLNLSYIINDDYERTDNLYSLSMAIDEYPNGFLCLNSDILFDKRIISDILKEKGNIVISVKKNDKCTLGDMRVRVDTNNKLLAIGKGLQKDLYGEYVGVLKIDKVGTSQFKVIIDHYSEGLVRRSQVGDGLNWLAALYNVDIIDIKDYILAEIDYYDDLLEAKNGMSILAQDRD